uniref:Uncharacterized protein n=1 Tax=Oryza glumipatula TaxID=40148 RepID=A0A0E0BTY9_9ORYZ
MSRRLSLPAGAPVTVAVSPVRSPGGDAVVRRGSGLTSPVPRHSLGSSTATLQVSPVRRSGGSRYLGASRDGGADESAEFVHYTVHIPPTPDRATASVASEAEAAAEAEEVHRPQRSYISGTIFTGGLNCATRGHVLNFSGEGGAAAASRAAASGNMSCKMRGCDMPAFLNGGRPPCDCGFMICKECYAECAAGNCPGCKEAFSAGSDTDESDSVTDDDDDEAVSSSEERDQLPLTSMARKFSVVHSMKVPGAAANGNGKPAEFDHARWLFETKGTYGYGNALWPKDGHAHSGAGFVAADEPPNFGARCRRPLTRKTSVSQAILSPYRLLIAIRLVALGFFLAWRIRHPNPEAVWLWAMSVACEVWFAFSWLLDSLPKLCPVHRAADLAVLAERFESPTARNPKGRSDLPGIDVFVTSADPEKEPPLVTANTILSILAADYPVEKLACYLSDDGGALLSFEALAETASFARTWVPFCRKHGVEPRCPEAYFGQKRDFLKNKVRVDFVRERRKVKREYDEFKVRVNSLPEAIRRRSDAYNAGEELRARRRQQEEAAAAAAAGNGELGAAAVETAAVKATWMSDGSHWPGTWTCPAADHARGDHAGIIQAMLAPPTSEPVMGGEAAECGGLIDTTGVDVRLPMLVYVSREKRPGYDHNKKAGAMNALVRTSAIMSNGPFILNLDCDHYVHNSSALREGMCFMLDRGGDRVCFVQFPQRFEGVDPSDRYANHNLVFFDVSMRAMDGLQGPMYVGTGCVFRRTALYGFSPPRATEHHGWLGRRKIKLFLTKKKSMGKKTDRAEDDTEMMLPPIEDDDGGADIEASAMLPKRFGGSATFVASIPVAEYQGRLLQDTPGCHHGRPAGALAVPREPLDAATVAEAIGVISCFYEEKTEWGRRIGWIYGSVTEDVVTGYRMHNRGWRSVYCVTPRRDAFRGTAPINLTDRLHQVLRWATGSVEIFFSRNNALFASPRMKLLQRVAYFNAGMYPFTSVFLLAYCLLPAVSLFSGKFIVQRLSATFLAFLLVITLTLCLLALLEIKWSGITLHEWWRNEQFWVIGGTSAHPAAVLQGLLKVIAGVDISFTLTSKPGNGGGDGGVGGEGNDDEAFAELYEVRWSYLMVPPVTIMMVNAVAIAVAAARTLYSEFPQWSKLLGGAFFSFWVLCHLYPFAKGLLGRRGRVPTIVFVWSGLISMIISLLWVYISPPAGARERIGGGGFSFP